MGKQKYFWFDGVNIPVTEEVYRAYYRPVWSEKKRIEREQRCRNVDGNRCTDDCERCDKTPDGGILSLDKFTEEGYEPAASVSVEEIVMEKLLMDELCAALSELSEDERSLIYDFYFEEQSERDIAAKRSVSQPFVHKKRKRVLKKIKYFFK